MAVYRAVDLRVIRRAESNILASLDTLEAHCTTGKVPLICKGCTI